jgi:hypothetical protein
MNKPIVKSLAFRVASAGVFNGDKEKEFKTNLKKIKDLEVGEGKFLKDLGSVV